MRSIVVASGKGGTGKTTLTALFALLAAREARVVLADADVEASNLPLALAARTDACEKFEGGAVARIEPIACANCGMCARVCRFDAIIEPARADDRTRQAVDPWACEGCGACLMACRYGAIKMQKSSAGQACSGTAITGPIAFGQLGPGEDLSGRLVTEVRNRAQSAAEAHEADVLLIDGPPGIGCPVIAAITNTDLLVAVTEPTVSGEHDLGRLVELAARLDVPVKVVLNKSDLSDDGAQRIRDLAARLDIDVIAEVPFDEELARLLPELAAGAQPDTDSPGLRAATLAWEYIAARQ